MEEEVIKGMISYGDFLKNFMSNINKDKIICLNIACGNDLFPFFFQGMNNLTIHGIDKNLSSKNKMIKYCNVTKDFFPFENDYFDVVLCLWGIEHFESVKNTFSEVNRVLKNGGSFVFLTPNKFHPFFFLNSIFPYAITKFYFKRILKKNTISCPTYYKCNTVTVIKKYSKTFRFNIKKIIYFGDGAVSNYFSFSKFLKKIVFDLEKILPIKPRLLVFMEKRDSYRG